MLVALAMVASVLVAAPAVAADDDPSPSYTATFDACMGVPASDFEDVADSHANAGDIHCIAYYGITKGTSATTYSPLMSVTREHMALFLTRLAGLVGIEMASDPAGPGFEDIVELPAESQTAINQLADLGITQGTSDTTYSPADPVTRGHMALFIARLMNRMDPMEVAGETYGYKPEDVVEVKAVADSDPSDNVDDSVAAVSLGSPFTDLGSATKSAYDAITALYELGVASGINATHYSPLTSITRASMAEFMAGVLDHSNARPAGISIQAVTSWAFGAIDNTDVVVSYRTDSFEPMVDVELLYFHTGNAVASDPNTAGMLKDDGTCSGTDGNCTGQENDFTDDNGNFSIDGAVVEGEMNTYYAWMSDDNNETFGPEATQASVALSSDEDATIYTVESDISKQADANTVDMDVTNSVTFTVQLKDGDATDTGDDVARPDVEINVAYRRYTDTNENDTIDDGADTLVSISNAKLTTDNKGQATYTVNAPVTDSTKDDESVLDQITFSSGLADPSNASLIVWTDDAPGTPNKAVIMVDDPGYAVKYPSDGSLVVDVSATVTLYDKYGNPAGRTYLVDATVGTGDGSALNDVHVNRKGQARLNRTKIPAGDGVNTVEVVIVAITEKDGTTDANISGAAINTENNTAQLVSKATGPTTATDVTVAEVYADEDKFRGSDNNLYSYDSDDTYVNAMGELIDVATFEETAEGKGIQVLVYDEEGSSIFRLTT
ncbi:MAG: S-layer homology domain-containing protein [bacterium]|nr:S-layer homology domain-containing protein [bacterium]